MLTLRKSQERGYADHGWLKSFHSFSFAGYYDPRHMGFGNLRVINEDRIAPGTGFGTHAHRDMEIISVVLSGELAHQDSMGNVAHIRPGEIQRMSAGQGVRHSEFNQAAGQTTHFLQIWIEPDRKGIEPGYEQRSFGGEAQDGKLELVAAPAGQAPAAVALHADARLYQGRFDGAQSALLALDPQRLCYVHVVEGTLQANGLELRGGDAARLAGESELRLTGGQSAQVLVFDLAVRGAH